VRRARARSLACFLVATYATAALPCSASPALRLPAAAATQAHGLAAAHETPDTPRAGRHDPAQHVDHGTHADHGPHADRDAGKTGATTAPDPDGRTWDAPCPCGCDDAPARAGASGARLGWAITSRQPDLVGPRWQAALAPPARRDPADPFLARDRVPI
jgi:hypothetical protein